MADGKVKIEVDVEEGKAKAKLEDVEDSAKDAGESLEDLGDSAGKGGKGLGALDIAAGNLVANGISALLGGLKDAVVGLVNLAEETREYREDMAKLETAFKTAGHDAEAASKTYEDFYAILGESDRSVEAVNHLAELTDNTADLSKWSTIAAGVTAKFGDSLPIEGLTEAANETAKVGKVTGPLADALNWAGISEDKFNKALEKCNSEQERAALITNTLNKEYEAAATEYNALTASAQEARRATARMEEAQAALGAVVEPFTTGLTNGKAALLEWAAGMLTTKQANDVLTESQRASVDVAREAAEAYRERKEATHEAALAQIADVDYATNYLLPQLQAIVDANGRVKQGYEERAQFLLGQMNEAWGTEYTRVSEIIGKNGELKQSVLDVIEAKKAQILLAAQEEDYKKAVENVAAAEQAWIEQAQAKAKAYEDVKAAEEEYTRAVEESKNKRGLLADVEKAEAQANLWEKQRILKEQTEAYNTAEADVQGYYADINSYDHAHLLIRQGNTTEAIKYLNDLSMGYDSTTGKVQRSIEEQMAILEKQAIDTGVKAILMREQYEKGVAGVTEEMVKTAEKAAETARTEFEQIGGQIGDGIGTGAEAKKPGLLTKIKNIVASMKRAAEEEADINSPSKEFEWIGNMLLDGLALGIDDRREKAINAMRSVGAEVIQEMHAAAKAEVKEIEKRSEDIVKAYEKRDKELQKQRNKSNGERIDAQREALRESHELEKEAIQKELELAKEKQKNYESFFNVYKTYTDNMLKLEESYADNVKKVNEKLASDIEAANNRYTSAFESRVASIKSGLSLFEEAEKGDFVTGRALTSALKSQIDVLEDYNKALDDLASKNVSQEFIEEMKGMGIDALPELEAINRMTEKELTKYVELWEEKNRLATEAATEELKGMRAETDAEIEALRLKAEEELAGLRQTYRDEVLALVTELGLNMQSVGDAGLKALGVQITLYSSMGSNLMQGVIDGIESEKDSIIASVVDNVIAAIEAAKEAAGIHSPSTLTRDEIGKNLGAGVAEGWHDELEGVKKTMASDLSGVVARVKATVSAENARFAHSTGVPDTGFSEMARAVGLQTAGINSLAGEFRRGTGTTRPIIIQLDKRELGRAVVDVGGTEELRIGAKLALGGAK